MTVKTHEPFDTIIVVCFPEWQNNFPKGILGQKLKTHYFSAQKLNANDINKPIIEKNFSNVFQKVENTRWRP